MLAIGAIALAGALLWVSRPRDADLARPIVPGESEHILVEVLNGTRVDGLARAITRRLRRQGIDVVYFGTAADSGLDTTRIVIRRGDSTAAVRVRTLLGLGRIVSDPDTTRLLDATVILGHDAAPLRGLEP